MKYAIGVLVTIVLISAGYYFYTQFATVPSEPTPTAEPVQVSSTSPTATSTPQTTAEEVIGKSVGDNDIVAYHFGSGDKEVLFIAGIHGGYEWNTVLVGYELIDYLKANPSEIPSNVKVTVIPVLNPDGLQKVTGKTGRFAAADVASSQSVQVSGRFNANGVDLNRNFDCDWKASGVWQNKTVSGGAEAFSEPESKALKTYVEAQRPVSAVVWYSSAGGVFASNCHAGVLPEASTLTSLFAGSSGYPAHASFDFYAITGDAVNWLAKQKIPAISVLLTNHTDVEWDKNLKGIQAVLEHYAE